VELSWQGGQGQTGYQIARLGGVPVMLPAGAQLSASTTSFLDTSTVGVSGVVCYLLLPSGVNPPVFSDLLCVFLNTRSPTGSPQNFALQLNQSTTATLSWTGPLDGGQTGYQLFPLGAAAPGPISLSASATSTTVPITGVACFLLVAVNGSTPIGNGDIACGFPGIATIAAATDSPAFARTASHDLDASAVGALGGSGRRLGVRGFVPEIARRSEDG